MWDVTERTLVDNSFLSLATGEMEQQVLEMRKGGQALQAFELSDYYVSLGLRV